MIKSFFLLSGRSTPQTFRRQLGFLIGAYVLLIVLWFIGSIMFYEWPQSVMGGSGEYGVADRLVWGLTLGIFIFIPAAIIYITPVILFLIALATIRRFHDRNKNAIWALLAFVPLIGWLWVFIECCFLAGSVGQNRYGLDPSIPTPE